MPDDGALPTLHDVGYGAGLILDAIAELTEEVRGLRAELHSNVMKLPGILARLDRIEAQLANTTQGRISPPPESPDVVALIATCVGSLAFNASELVDHCRLPAAAPLRAALVAACGGALDPRRVGKLLQRLSTVNNVQGAPVQDVARGGYVIRRISRDREGTVWQCDSAGPTVVDSHTGGRYCRPD